MTHTISKVSAVTLGTALLVATFFSFAPAAEARRGGDGDDVRVANGNAAVVMNVATVNASTGNNEADGGDGGNGGNARGRNADGGNGGRGGDGGSVTTGAATAIGTISNDVNSNRTTVEGCGCDNGSRGHRGGGSDDDVTVRNGNIAFVGNGLMVNASTGGNDVEGDEAGDGGNGNGSYRGRYHRGHGHGGNDGGNGGRGGDGGTVPTGAATSDGLITNVVNRNITRVDAGSRLARL